METNYILDTKHKEELQKYLTLFIEQVDRCIKNGKTTKGVEKALLKEKINQLLQPINYVCHPNFGSGNLTEIPNISFYRDDLFSLIKVNGIKPSLQSGVYIWFGYAYKEESFYLKFGFPEANIENSRCIAVNKMDEDGICDSKGKYFFVWKKNNEILSQVIEKLLFLVDYFNQFPASEFQDTQAKEKFKQLFNAFQNKLYPFENQTPQELKDLASKNKIKVVYSSNTQNSGLYLLRAKEKGIKALAVNSDHPFENHISCADFLRYCDNDKTTYPWTKPIYQLILGEKNISHYDIFHDDEILEVKQLPLNQILYGSPGTGKTYSTIDKALEILGVDTKTKNRQELKEIFDDYKARGQIKFVTFHQNYGYEEFIEGIKPKLDNNKNNDLEYEIKAGIFKSLCTDADSFNYIDLNTNLWRLYTFPNGDQSEDYFDECVREKFVYAYSRFGMEELQFKVKNGDYIIIPSVVSGKRSKSIRAFGVLGNVITNTSDSNRSFRTVEWKWIATNEEQELIFKQADFGIPAFRAVEKEKETILKTLQKHIEGTPHILIIDEINRGNVSKIFGELITLIEPSKRIGKDEELRVTLPYSQNLFGVPSNLYIIGTMNTADRSITSLDTALRRRFEFVEMMPDETKLKSIEVMHDGEKKTINLQELLKAINERIEYLYDREKTIGHAYLMDISSLSGLKEVFQNKIIPLLQEYFHNDYEAIQAILNGNGMIRIKEDENKYLSMGKFDSYVKDKGMEDKKVFEITPKNIKDVWDNVKTYLAIYDEKNAQEIRKKQNANSEEQEA